MRTLGTIRGYANVFNEFSTKLDGDEPLRERIMPGAFKLLCFPVAASVSHVSKVQIGTTLDRSLRLWQDNHGVAIELGIPATPDGVGMRDMVASGFCAMSFGLTDVEAEYSRDETGCLCRSVVRCDLDHVSIVEAGAYPSACCWVAGTPADRMSPKIAAASRRWYLGRIAHVKKQAEDRKMVANFLATPGASERFFAKAG
jgi:HK97 family phage prohead protease